MDRLLIFCENIDSEELEDYECGDKVLELYKLADTQKRRLRSGVVDKIWKKKIIIDIIYSTMILLFMNKRKKAHHFWYALKFHIASF